MIRIERVPMPAGLRAVARRDDNGDLVIYVSSALDSGRQRGAVMQAVRASRRAGWRGALPLGIAMFAGLRVIARRAVTLLHLRSAAAVATGSAVAAAAVIAAVVMITHPQHRGPSIAEQLPGGGTGVSRTVPASARPGGQRAAVGPGSASPGVSAGQPGAGPTHSATGRTSPHPTSSNSPSPSPSTSPSPTPTPRPTSPSPSPTRSSPSPSPSPSPTKKGSGGTCVIVLGVWVCVPLKLSPALQLFPALKLSLALRLTG